MIAEWAPILAQARRDQEITSIRGIAGETLRQYETNTRTPSLNILCDWASQLDHSVMLVPYDDTWTYEGLVAYAADHPSDIIQALQRLRVHLNMSYHEVARGVKFSRQWLAKTESTPGGTHRIPSVLELAMRIGAELTLVPRDDVVYRAWVERFEFHMPGYSEGHGYEGSVNELPGHVSRYTSAPRIDGDGIHRNA